MYVIYLFHILVLSPNLGFMFLGYVGKLTVSSKEEDDEALEAVKFNFNIESLGLVLYSNDATQVNHLKKNDHRNVWSTVD